MSVQSIAKYERQELWVEYEGNYRMFFRKSPDMRLCWSMLGYVLVNGAKIEGFARRTGTGFEFLPL
jgi:hypothetical protein